MIYELIENPYIFVILCLFLFIILFLIGFHIRDKEYINLKADVNNLEHILPSDEIRTLQQLFYIVMSASLILIIVIELFGEGFYLEQSIIDIIFCLITMYVILSTNKHKKIYYTFNLSNTF